MATFVLLCTNAGNIKRQSNVDLIKRHLRVYNEGHKTYNVYIHVCIILLKYV